MSEPNHDSLMLPPGTNERRSSIQTDTSETQASIGSSNAPSRVQSTRASSVTGDGQADIDPSKSLFIEKHWSGYDESENHSVTEDSDAVPAVHHGILHPPSERPVTSIIKNNPHSNTAIGRLTYELENLPALFVAKLKIVYSPRTDKEGESTTWPVVKHSKIRKDAIKEILSNLRSARLAGDIAVIQDANTTVDHLVAPFNDEVTLHREFHPHRINLQRIKKMGSKADVNSGADSHRSLACEVLRRSGELDEYSQAQLYWKSLCSFIRMRASQADDPTGHSIHTEFVQLLSTVTGQVNNVDPYEGFKQQITLELGTGLSLGVRIVPSFTTEHKRLHLDFDVVPFIHKGSLHNIIFDVFGKNGLLAKPLEYIDVLRDLLAELQVRCAYIPYSTDPASDSATLLDPSESHRGRLFRIRAIEMPENVPGFNVDNEHHTVSSYFNRYVLLQARSLRYPSLPLVSDGKDHWVPLEMLIVEHAQALRHKRFLSTTKAAAQSVLSTMEGPKMEAVGQGFLNRINVLKWANGKEEPKQLFDTKGRAVFIPNVRDIAPQSAPKSTKKQVAMSAAVPSVQFGIIEQEASETRTGDLDSKVLQGFQTQRAGEPTYNYSYSTCAHATIQSVQKFINENIGTTTSQVTTNNNAPKLLLGLMGNETSIFTEQLRTYVDRTSDILLVDVKKGHLEQLFEKHPDRPSYLPLTIRAKANFMLGGTNFATNVLAIPSGKDLSRLMIVGAHVKRPVDSWKKYAPSVAAVVASKDSHALQFPGSARIQATFESCWPITKASKIVSEKVVESRITKLTHMMIERFKAWSDESAPPTQILYYRAGISFDDRNIRIEYDDIRTAYANVWPGTTLPQITIVVYGKNAQVTFLPETKSNQDDKYNEHESLRIPPVRPEFIYTTSPTGPQKNAHYVATNEIDFTPSDLRALTTNLNTSSQLSPQNDQTAKPLPLVWAKKLAARVHGYYHEEFLKEDGRIWSVDDEYGEEQTRVLKRVQEGILGLEDGGESGMWRREGEGRMFWL